MKVIFTKEEAVGFLTIFMVGKMGFEGSNLEEQLEVDITGLPPDSVSLAVQSNDTWTKISDLIRILDEKSRDPNPTGDNYKEACNDAIAALQAVGSYF